MQELNYGAPTDWNIRIQRNDGKVTIDKQVPNDELEYGVDDALRDARDRESNLPS